MFATTSKGIIANPHLEALLGGACVLVGKSRPTPTDIEAVVGWGFRPSSEESLRWAVARSLPFLRIEDGLLRSIGLGQKEPSYSLVVDDLGLYIDATRESRFEVLMRDELSATGQSRARTLTTLWRKHRVSKYNGSREYGDPLPPHYVLVIDQTFGDASIGYGGASASGFERMLQAALDENPGVPIWLKVHPEVLSGRKRGHFDLARLCKNDRVTIIGTSTHPVNLIENAESVYTVTSQVGFEALLWGKKVRTFGMPFYAGWGLTRDDISAPPRRGPMAYEKLIHTALISYPRYVDPETGRRCDPEKVIEWIGFQRTQRARFAPKLKAVGFSKWKHPILRDFAAGSEIQFHKSRDVSRLQGDIVAWASKYPVGENATRNILRVEDGFVRSVGLGADGIRPLSWVFDRTGIYYDARHPSDLEDILQKQEFDETLVERAEKICARIVSSGLTKYNVGSSQWSRPQEAARVILVTGQVEQDASIRFGASRIHTNLGMLQEVRQLHPEAYVLYKPHPDVIAGLRARGQGENEARQWCDEIITEYSIADLFPVVDEVHVLTSLAGFEALLRGRMVVTYGQPFYAGWGLTRDLYLTPEVLARRTRRLGLYELVAGTLILYPTYIGRKTGKFITPERALDELEEWKASPDREAGRHAKSQNWFKKLVRLLMGTGSSSRNDTV